MEEAAVLCDRVAIMHQGKILSLDAPKKLISKYVGNEIWEIEVDSGGRDKTVRELESHGLDYEVVGDKIHIFHVEVEESIRGLLNSPGLLRRRLATLEDVFFKLTGRSLLE